MTKQNLAPKPMTGATNRFGEPFRWLRNEVDRLFEDVDPGTRLFQWAQPGFPALDMEERDDAYHLTAEVPGYNRDQIDLSVSDGCVVMRGERSSQGEGEEGGMLFSERHQGRFERRIALPGRFDADRIKAKLDRGVLDITVPKLPDPEQRSVKIESA